MTSHAQANVGVCWALSGLIGFMSLGIGQALAASGDSEEVEGAIIITGSGPNREVTLVPEGKPKGPGLCKGEVANKLEKLSGFHAKVKGLWQLSPKGKKVCLEVPDFEITKASGGKPALIGTLEGKNGVYSVRNSSGQETVISDIPSGLKKFEGKKVILNVKPAESGAAGLNAPGVRVLGYTSWPE